jgi:type VI secretion system protein ImpB
MPRESTQHKFERVCPPRMHLTCDVEISDATELKELAFVMGVLADLSGKPEEPPRLRDRKFIEIDRDNFNDVMKEMKPRLAFQLDNQLTNDNTKMGVELRFNSIEDFEPEQVARQVEPLAKLMEVCCQLSGLLAKADCNDRLGEKLLGIIGNTELAEKIAKEASEPAGQRDKQQETSDG